MVSFWLHYKKIHAMIFFSKIHATNLFFSAFWRHLESFWEGFVSLWGLFWCVFVSMWFLCGRVKIILLDRTGMDDIWEDLGEIWERFWRCLGTLANEHEFQDGSKTFTGVCHGEQEQKASDVC